MVTTRAPSAAVMRPKLSGIDVRIGVAPLRSICRIFSGNVQLESKPFLDLDALDYIDIEAERSRAKEAALGHRAELASCRILKNYLAAGVCDRADR